MTRLLFTLLALNRAGRILWALLIAIGVTGFLASRIWLPAAQFTEEDEQLFRAARHGDVSGIERALTAGAGVNDRSPVDGKTALFRAAVFGHSPVVRLLLERGADAAARGYDDLMPIDAVDAAIRDEKDPRRSNQLHEVAAALRNAAAR